MNGDKLTLRPEATAGIVRADDRAQRRSTTGRCASGTSRPDVPPRAAAEGPLPPVPPDRRRGARLRRPRCRRRADPDVPRALARPRPGARAARAARAQQPGPAGRAPRASRRADRPPRGARRRARRGRAAPPAHQPAAHPRQQEPGDAAGHRGGAAADRLPRRGVAGALRRRCAPCSTPSAWPTASTRAWCAAWTTTTSRCSSGSPTTSARRARSAAAAATTACSSSSAASRRRRSAGAWASSACCCCSRRSPRRCRPQRSTSTPSCPAPQALAGRRGRRARRCAAPGVAVQMHAAGADGWGSMKAQFRRADASGARYALVFGDDELARGEVAVKALRDAAQAQRLVAAGRPRRVGSRPSPHNPRFARRSARHGHAISTSKNRNSSTSSRRSGSNTATSSPGVLIVVARRLRGLVRLELVAARPGRSRPARCTTSSTAPLQAGDAERTARIFADMKERYPARRVHRPGGPGWPPSSPAEKGKADAARADLAWVADSAARRRVPDDRPAAPRRAAARREEVRRGAEAARRRRRRRLRGARRRPPRRRPHGPGQGRRGQGRLRARPGRRWTRRSTTAASSRPSSTSSASTRRQAPPAAPGAPSEASARRSSPRLALAGCSSWNPLNWNPFGPDRPEPKALQPIVAPISAAQVWKAEHRRVEFPMVPAVNGDVLTLACERRQRRRRSRRRPVARSGAPTSAPSSPPASAATARSRRW